MRSMLTLCFFWKKEGLVFDVWLGSSSSLQQSKIATWLIDDCKLCWQFQFIIQATKKIDDIVDDDLSSRFNHNSFHEIISETRYIFWVGQWAGAGWVLIYLAIFLISWTLWAWCHTNVDSPSNLTLDFRRRLAKSDWPILPKAGVTGLAWRKASKVADTAP
jgi:hypothetical protein